MTEFTNKVFVKAHQKAWDKALKEANEETLQKLAKGTFAKDLKKTTNNIAELVQKYVNKDIGEVQFVDGLINSGFRDLSGQFLEAAGIDKSVLCHFKCYHDHR